MKNLLLLAILSFSLGAVAQNNSKKTKLQEASIKLPKEPRFYINVHGGYSIATGSTFKYYADDVQSVTVEKVGANPASKVTRYSEPGRGLGGGARFGVGVSYVLNDYLNIGVDLDYSRSSISRARDSSYRHSFAISGINAENYYKETITTSYRTELLTLTPHVTLKAITRPKWLVYSKLGAVLNVKPSTIQTEENDANYRFRRQNVVRDSAVSTSKRYYWGIRNPSFGFMSGLGIQLKLSEKVRAFSEVQFSHIVFVARSRVFTNYTVNDRELISTLPASERRVNYSSAISTRPGSDPNQPSQAIVQRIPVTFAGGHFGIGFRL